MRVHTFVDEGLGHARTGATFLAPAAARLETPHRCVRDGERVRLAPGVVLEAIATPGHTPDRTAYVVEGGGRPEALFSGGSLMMGTVGRTDLCGPENAAALVRAMYRSLRRFSGLPDTLAVYPTHGAGSFCAAPGSAARVTTLGNERATNPLLRCADEDPFVATLLDGLGTFPPYFARLPEVNRRGPRRFDALPDLPRLDVGTVARHRANGALIVDARPVAEFGPAHVPGATSSSARFFGPGCPTSPSR